jgi:heme/copper-type cytochrome/quinol oxidase subunit 2
MTSFDLFLADARSWLDSAWYLWVIMAGVFALVIGIVAISKVRARSRERVPQYRRGERSLSSRR